MDAYVLALNVEDSQHLPTRAKNVLKRLGCETLEDVTKLTPKQILRAKWAGKKVLNYIKLWLDQYGLSLADSTPSPTGFPLLNGYLQSKSRLFEYFGYTGRDFPMEDCTNTKWYAWSTDTIYRGKDFSMIVTSNMDTCLGALCIYDNAKEVEPQQEVGRSWGGLPAKGGE